MRRTIVKILPVSRSGHRGNKLYNGEHIMKEMTRRAREEEADKMNRADAVNRLQGSELIAKVHSWYRGDVAEDRHPVYSPMQDSLDQERKSKDLYPNELP